MATVPAYNYLKRLSDYLYETEYTTENIDQEFCYNYFMTPLSDDDSDTVPASGCTGVYFNGRTLRQLDWFYDNEVEFIVRRNKDTANSKHASIGIAAGLPSLTKDFVASGEYTEKYRLVPFAMVDGMNDCGVFIQSNVTPRKNNNIEVTHTSAEYKGKITINMIPRIVLDNCASVNDVENELSKYDIIRTVRLQEEYDSHFLIADRNGNHKILEFTSDGTSFNLYSFAGDKDAEILSNFCVDGVGSIENGTFALDWNAISDNSGHNAGLERWEIVKNNILGNTPSLEVLRDKLRYTRMYSADEDPQWYTEACGMTSYLTPATAKLAHEGDVTAKANFDEQISLSRTDFINRGRTVAGDHSTWQTVHSAIYDLNNAYCNLMIQEDFDNEFITYLKETKNTLIPVINYYIGLSGIEDYLDYTYNITDDSKKKEYINDFVWNAAEGAGLPAKNEVKSKMYSYFGLE